MEREKTLEARERGKKIKDSFLSYLVTHHTSLLPPAKSERINEGKKRKENFLWRSLEHNDVLFFHTGQKLRRKGERFLRQMGWAGEEEEERKK